ncbi:Vs.1 conserved hypothetical protein [Aeromonas phage phiAS5]|uniref:Transglycosylase SLT domain-containing protein n=1 Tax=Aeromonas phage phiAS5 TaxID=879630 RepID=E1A2G3_9CAUD|nr:hypothetical protein phiAS5_ORF0066 [Aeromonas phage phiAS5]ADM79909.1 Vs.1 conserved hypothetical protein [Aeromonas phage phiAS5]BES53321.1 hypothetical protein [Aeromonas phage phiWae14]
MLKKFALLLALMGSAFNANATNDLDLNENQLYVVNRAYELGQSMDYGMTFAAIALTESQAGEDLVNNVSGDYGVFQNNLRYTVRAIEKETGYKMSPKQVRDLKKGLIENMELSASMTELNLKYWQSVHGKKSWSKVIASYNAGFNYRGKDGQTYLAKVKSNMRKLQNCDCIAQ